MQDMRLTYTDLMIYFSIANAVLGLLFGLFPLVVGLKMGNVKYGVIGLIASIIGGLLLSVILAVPIALAFTLLALRSQAAIAAGDPA
ncbi:MAG TPA: hypothetical protein VGJ02_05780 [Pyrinomonadaceae bacterium]|jgi:hypothetical protein